MRPEDLLGEYQKLHDAVEAGNLRQDRFAALCEGLVAQDGAGTWWRVDTAGQLLSFSAASNTWVVSAPAAAGPGPGAGAGASRTASAGKRKAAPHPSPVAAPALPPAAAAAVPAGPGLSSGLAGLVIVFIASLTISWLSWDLLKIVPDTINQVIPTGSCTNFTPGSTGMYFCSAFIGLRVVFGSLVLAVVLIILRKPIGAVINKLNAAMPADWRSVMPAVVAALFFAVVWSGSHASTGHLWGVLPHRAFPAVVGVLVHITVSWGPGFMARHASFFDARDRLPTFTRWLIVLLTPTVVSLVITYQERVSNEALKQQFVVLVGMLVAFVVMTPRSGKLADLRQTTGIGR